MSKNKLAKFAEMATFSNVIESPAKGADLFTTDANIKGNWHKQVFHNINPIVVELGCGRGEYSVGLARKKHDTNFIGVDIKGARMYHGAKKALEEGLGNVVFLRTNIEFIERFFAADEVSEIWLTFCDPQMKKATKRLTSSFFLQRYRSIMKDGGIVHLKTDSPFLFTYTDELVRLNALPVIQRTQDLYADKNLELPESLRTIQTYYEQQWLSRGKTIKYIAFELPHAGNLLEPDIEIEKDDYRSVGARSGAKSKS
ncbi:MAG: tRNA (guanosine(46)-N7)-methyltransferase TrmB [Paludibacteraceae bacterium]|nr:tRNA (guanosine(46)-N7)-methyltransferase TrmB [Paludibacteraceae bacterium]